MAYEYYDPMDYGGLMDVPVAATAAATSVVGSFFAFLNHPGVQAAVYASAAGLGIYTGYRLAQRPDSRDKGVGWTSFALSILLAVYALSMVYQTLVVRA